MKKGTQEKEREMRGRGRTTYENDFLAENLSHGDDIAFIVHQILGILAGDTLRLDLDRVVRMFDAEDLVRYSVVDDVPFVFGVVLDVGAVYLDPVVAPHLYPKGVEL